ncbi:MAG TPA: hypothetical protein VH853_12545 [Polyangia bacterium]|nr:hypothetical protein [Polyangia bacterium]
MRRSRLWVVTGIVIGASVPACVTTQPAVAYSAINVPPRALVRRAPADVDVVLGETPLRPHVDVGLFEVYEGQRPDGTWESTEEMIQKLHLYAALRGCDAVKIFGVTGGAYQLRTVRGGCEMYTDEAAQHAVVKPAPPLPGEGKPCPMIPGPTGGADCPGALVCKADRCVSPYP